MREPKEVAAQIVTLWKEHFRNPSNHEGLLTFNTQSGLFDQIKQGNLLTVVFSFADLSILHINEAAANYFGGTVDEIIKAGAPFIISCFDKEQLKFATFAAEVSAKNSGKLPKNALVNSYVCYGNWIINNKNGISNRAIFRIFPIVMNDFGFPLIGMYLINDIKPFLRADTWWYRSTIDYNNFSYYHSDEKKLVDKDLLSDREKTILKYLSEGLSSKEIAMVLHLSNHTVDNHRRKMLAKTGAIDSSALIHVAKLSGIL